MNAIRVKIAKIAAAVGPSLCRAGSEWKICVFNFGEHTDFIEIDDQSGAIRASKSISKKIKEDRDTPANLSNLPLANLAKQTSSLISNCIMRVNIASDLVLSQTIELPVSLSHRVKDIVRENISVWTPFTDDEIIWATRILRKPTMTGMSHQIIYVPKRTIESVQTRYHDLGIEIDQIGVDAFPFFQWRTKSAKNARFVRRDAILRGAVGLCILQLVSLTALILHNSYAEKNQLNAAINLAERNLIAQARLQRQIEALRVDESAITHSMGEYIGVGQIYRAMSDQLVQGAWVHSFVLSDARWRATVYGPVGVDAIHAKLRAPGGFTALPHANAVSDGKISRTDVTFSFDGR